LGLTFFGRGPNYRSILFDQLFYLVYTGKSFTFTEVYNMPVPYRRYFIDKLSNIIDAQNKEVQKAQSNQKVPGQRFPKNYKK